MIIKCTLSSASLRDAAKQLRQYADSLPKKTETMVRRLGEYGTDSAMLGLGHIDTGETLSSIQYTHRGTEGTISAGGAAVWIEFGTGVLANVGSEEHPKRGEVGAVGWGEYGHGLGKGRWWYKDKNGEKKWTIGIRMRPFMYEASMDMRNALVKIAKEAFRID